MADQPHSEPSPTLASLRRRGGRRPAVEQPNLFSGLAPDAEGGFVFAAAEDRLAEGQASAADAKPEAGQWAAAAEPRTIDEPVARAAEPMAAVGVTQKTVEVQVAAEPVAKEEPRTWTVSGLVRHVRGLVEQGYGQVAVEGEISNWRPAGSGHCYFTLKDAGAQLSAVMFRREAALLRFRPADGDAVRLHGQLSVYESRGQMQLIVEWMEQVGLGALLAAVQRLKEKLRREGLFDRKRPLPPFPKCIGVVTSLRGAALRDIVKVCRRRNAAVQLLIYPAAVQGPNCAAEVAAGVRWFNAHPERAEVVLVARGGGSWEDLHGFDDERVARAIAGSALPVITGIGHATDATIADAAADVCAPTPSAAAELLTAAQHRVEERVERLRGRLMRAGSHQLLRAQGRFTRLNAASVLRRVEDELNRQGQRVDELGFRAEAALRGGLRGSESRLRGLSGRLERQSPAVRLAEAGRRLEVLRAKLMQRMEQRTAERGRRVDRCVARLEAMSPLSVLERGYALVYDSDGRLVREAASVGAGEEIRARVARGELRARVLRGET